jgi:hypothetical protein
MTKKYRFYVMRVYGKFYAITRGYATTERTEATLFTDEDWEKWGQSEGFVREELGEDEKLRILGAPTLPGFDL